MFLYPPTFNMLHLQKEKALIMLLVGYQRGCIVLLFFCYTLHFCIARIISDKKGVEFDKEFLVVEQNNYAFKIVNACIVYELDTWPKVSLKNFKLKNRMFGATNIVK